jgi:hypothetical protein
MPTHDRPSSHKQAKTEHRGDARHTYTKIFSGKYRSPHNKEMINFSGRILTSARILDSYLGYSLSMIHPVITFTSRSIAAKAFQQFIQPNPGESPRKFPIESIGKSAQLRNLNWQQLTPKYPAAAIALAKALAGELESIDRIASFLEVEMLDEVFAL